MGPLLLAVLHALTTSAPVAPPLARHALFALSANSSVLDIIIQDFPEVGILSIVRSHV